MSHTIYTTEGLILKSVGFGEANKYFSIYTKDFGLIQATAQSVRHLKSKLRYHLRDFSLGHISLVRGREVWRITSADGKINLQGGKHFALLSRIFSLLLRLVQGEEQNDLLFNHLKEGLIFLENYDNNKQDDIKILANFECILALRILSTLGYIGQIGDFEQFISSPYFTQDLIMAMSGIKSKAICEINKSLKETNL